MPTEDGLLTKQEVQEFLDVSSKSVERYIAMGRLIVTKQIRPAKGGRRQPLFDLAHVEDFKRHHIPYAPIAPDATNQTDKTTTTGGSAGALVPDVARWIQTASEALKTQTTGTLREGDRLLLTLPQCVDSTGLAESHLQKAARDGRLTARKVSNAWRVRPGDLRAYVDALFAVEGED